MTITAKIIEDSITRDGLRLTTMQLRYPRMIHAEVMTHRVFSRNASSSRAIPVSKVIEDVMTDPAMPSHWGKNQPGMQAEEEHNALIPRVYVFTDLTREAAWLMARDSAVEVAKQFAEAGYHKQIVNRLLEPFSHINVVVTSVNYNNFYALRRHKDAQPEIKLLADAMWEAQQASEPFLLKSGNWHLPYIRHKDTLAMNAYMTDKGMTNVMANYLYDTLTSLLIKVSVARCARTSYLLHDGKETTIEADMGLYDRLLASEPLHASPAEHQATPDVKYRNSNGDVKWFRGEKHGNLPGFIQFRKTLDGEFVQ